MTLECDTVLNAVGFRPNNQLEDLLDENMMKLLLLEMLLHQEKFTAIHEGYHANSCDGMEI